MRKHAIPILLTVMAVLAAWDINQDNAVNVLDMSLVGQDWNETGSPGWIACMAMFSSDLRAVGGGIGGARRELLPHYRTARGARPVAGRTHALWF